MSTTALSRPAATPVGERSLAPDLARGFMLLLIAVAHAHMYLAYDDAGFRGYAVDGGVLDRLVAGVQILLVDGRALPMFAALFGYGLVRLSARRPDPAEATRLVRRRGRWLLAFGFCHALLLFFGDILAAYGLIALVFAGMLRRSDRALLRAAALTIPLHVLVLVGIGLSTISAGHAESPTVIADPLAALGMRLGTWTALTPTFYLVSALPSFFLGAWAARRRMLDEPAAHRPFLRRIAWWGIGAGVVGGLPLTLADTHLWDPADGPAVAAYALHSVTGIAAGVGYAALIGLIATRLRRPGRLTRALAECGRRSLTCYVLQSVAFTVIFTPFALGLGDQAGDAAASAIGAAVWLSTVVVAALMAKAGYRGPLETLLRRLTYGRR
ncbi:DUF418 domain-containing protein [Phytomonospora endophytica]|uniref:Putative membrane protein YeiB n=1 Tax=Phytomonospora endophytica TaxID=714109 RepID=A0A841FRP4_9ACTN|nr:DUF418 domain-containing protein [Phytomonospora endophytica]MBB6035977.1 putative membrane protein YeiB [Phytomonospora endophytica]GIG66883.1 hypothetical protein Pen01_31780 [Phytomonospora endophytica]